MCVTGKRSYQSRSDAKRAMRRIQSHSKQNKVCAIYKCWMCGHHHLSSQPTRKAHP